MSISCLYNHCRGAYRYLRLLGLMYYYQRLNLTVPRVFKQTVARHGSRRCLVHLDKSWTFRDLEEYSNRVANFFLREGYRPGDCVALQMHNRPEYVGLWLGCAKIGVVPALINTNLRGEAFLHSLKEVSATACILGTEDMAGAERTESCAYLGTQGVRVMNPHPHLASGSHCSIAWSLCIRTPTPHPQPSKFEGSVPSYGLVCRFL